MIKIAVVCEAPADFRQGAALVDRVLCDAIDWLEEGLLDSQRNWHTAGRPDGFLKWAAVSEYASFARGLRYIGHADRKPAGPDALNALRALVSIAADRPDAIVMLRDQDDQPERRDGLAVAKEKFRGVYPEIRVIIGFAVIERESWVLSGFEAIDDRDKAALLSERRKLGFDPTAYPERLDAGKNDQAIKSPKRVLSILTSGHSDREQRSWLSTPLETLRINGTGNGLAAFLGDCEAFLVPLIQHIQTP